MKTKTTTILLAAVFGALTAHAQLTIPSDGSDGAFSPAANVEIDLGLATTARVDWSQSPAVKRDRSAASTVAGGRWRLTGPGICL